MTSNHEKRAREILEQAAADNADRPIGVTRHRVRLIAQALGVAEARCDLLVGHLREIERRFWIYQPRGTDAGLSYLASAVADAGDALANIDKETT